MQSNQKLVIQRLGKSFRECTELVSEPVQQPGTGEVLIRNHFAGVNGVYDQMMCLNRVDHQNVVPPAGTGVEAVGLIEAVGSDVQNLEVGTPVATVIVGQGYSRFQTCKAADVIPIPAAEPEILALIPSGVSALLALEKVAEIKPGDLVCISAAAGGLGNMLVQLAVHNGNRTIAICGSDEKATKLKQLGAARVIQYRKESIAEVIENEFKDQLDVAMDSVGGAIFDTLLDNLAPFGRLVVCGFTSDRVPTESVTQERVYTKLYWKAASVRGFMNHRFAAHAAEAREKLLSLYSQGHIQPLIADQRFKGLASVADAVEHLLAGDNVGKVVVDLRG